MFLTAHINLVARYEGKICNRESEMPKDRPWPQQNGQAAR
jgi:hypothetical protein